MSHDPGEVQRSEEEFRRSLARFGWTQPLLTFIGLFSFGLVFYGLSQTPAVDGQFPAGFLIGLASGLMSTAVIFYFFENAFGKRMERRASYMRQSGMRRRVTALAVRKQTISDRQTMLLGRVSTLVPGGLPSFQPKTRAEAQQVIVVLNGLLGTMQELEAADEEQAAALRENVQIQAEEGSTSELDAALDVLLGLIVERQRHTLLRQDVLVSMRRLESLLPALPADSPPARSASGSGE
jgi:hypothetical protein